MLLDEVGLGEYANDIADIDVAAAMTQVRRARAEYASILRRLRSETDQHRSVLDEHLDILPSNWGTDHGVKACDRSGGGT